MAGYDQKSNVVLSDSKERVYSIDEGVEEIPLGLYLVKGDMMCVLLFLIFLSILYIHLRHTSLALYPVTFPRIDVYELPLTRQIRVFLSL